MMEKFSLRMIAVGMLACILLWAGAAELFQKPVIPSPVQVFFRLTATFTGTIAIHAAYSLMRITVGVLAAVAVGYPLGILMGYFRRVNHLLAPILYLTYPIPKIALLPVVMLLFGVGETSKLLLVFLIIVFQVIDSAGYIFPAARARRVVRTDGAAHYRARLAAEVHHGCARGDGNGNLCPLLHGDIRHAVWHRLLHHGCVAARELPRYVRRHRSAECNRAAALHPARSGRASAVRVEPAVDGIRRGLSL